MEQTKILERIKFHEGLRLMPYRDNLGKLTIGIGRCIDTKPFTEDELRFVGDWKHGITLVAAYQLCRKDISQCQQQLNTLGFWYHNLDDERKYALIDMCFQLGFDGLKGFKNMLKNIEKRNWYGAYYECLNSKYARQTPTRAKRIAILLKTGRWYENIKEYKEV